MTKHRVILKIILSVRIFSNLFLKTSQRIRPIYKTFLLSTIVFIALLPLLIKLFSLFCLPFFCYDFFNDILLVHFHLIDEYLQRGKADITLACQVIRHYTQTIFIDSHKDIDATFTNG